uniref:Nonstructural protein n=1 Tax=Dulem virus 105 TaxID=3145582 RepID=A0AAU8B1R1_9VIRU
MSKKVLVSVFDKVAGLYSPAMTEINPDSAIRNFKIGAKQNQQINVCPEDYCLVFLGTVDDETGSIAPVESADGSPVILFQAKDLFPAE